MNEPCTIPWNEVWNWISNSQIFSTIVLLLFGTFLFDWWAKRKETQRATVWWLIEHLEEYAKMANDYWAGHPNKNNRQHVLAARLKSEYTILLSAIDDCTGPNKKARKELRDEMTKLFEAATGGVFETQKRISDGELIKILAHISSCSGAMRRRLRPYTL